MQILYKNNWCAIKSVSHCNLMIPNHPNPRPRSVLSRNSCKGFNWILKPQTLPCVLNPSTAKNTHACHSELTNPSFLFVPCQWQFEGHEMLETLWHDHRLQRPGCSWPLTSWSSAQTEIGSMETHWTRSVRKGSRRHANLKRLQKQIYMHTQCYRVYYILYGMNELKCASTTSTWPSPAATTVQEHLRR